MELVFEIRRCAQTTDDGSGSFQFRVTVEGINDPLDGFIKVSAIKITTESMDFKHGMDRMVRHADGRSKVEPVTLERVYSGLDEFSAWRTEVENGNIDRRTVGIEFLRNDGVTVVRKYTLLNAWPSDWELPDMDAGSSNTSVEKITLQVERVIQEA